MPANGQLTYFARSLGGENIGIAQPDRLMHSLFIGRSGTGKSTALLTQIIQDIKAGRGVGLIDPHGDLAEAVLPFIPRARQKHLVYLNPADLDFPIALNMLYRVAEKERHLVADNLVSIFHKIWVDSWGPRMAYVLRNALLALLENPGSTLLSLVKFLTDREYRQRLVKNIHDPFIRYYWQKEFAAYPDRLVAEIISPIQNKIGAYLANRPLRNILGQSRNSIQFSRILDHGGIFICNLSKGLLGEEAANLLGSFLLSGIVQAAMRRADMPENERREFFLYIDEFHNFTTQSFTTALAEIRKYGVGLTLAHQYLGQLDESIRQAVLANVGTLVVFRVGSEDPQVLAKEFGYDWDGYNLTNLDPYEIYYKTIE